ncbi:hypothetical protein EVAR_93337_1 [Eumeta japonica]|uniref:Uncharacterized protein n=1 Tax=Eumeta variegata TaxID=151549 RepID=A0A4C1UTJ1_EUMVA|nr:hypothetical protein EVAR_93337_1 [Eumeta japonica]
MFIFDIGTSVARSNTIGSLAGFNLSQLLGRAQQQSLYFRLSSISPILPPSRIVLSSRETGNALITLLWSYVCPCAGRAVLTTVVTNATATSDGLVCSPRHGTRGLIGPKLKSHRSICPRSRSKPKGNSLTQSSVVFVIHKPLTNNVVQIEHGRTLIYDETSAVGSASRCVLAKILRAKAVSGMKRRALSNRRASAYRYIKHPLLRSRKEENFTESFLSNEIAVPPNIFTVSDEISAWAAPRGLRDPRARYSGLFRATPEPVVSTPGALSAGPLEDSNNASNASTGDARVSSPQLVLSHRF